MREPTSRGGAGRDVTGATRRVLHVRNASGYYGAERCIVTWIEELVPRGYAFDLAVYPHPDPSTTTFLEAARAAGATVHLLPRAHAQSLRAFGRLVSLVRRRRIDLLHAHENRTHVMAYLAGALTGRPVVGTLHGYVPSSSKMARMNALNRRFLRGARLAALTVPTRDLGEQLARAHVMPNALPESLAAGALAAERAPHPPTFGVVGRLNPEKGIAHFLDALEGLPAAWRFTVVGSGVEEERLRAHPQAARVDWPGFREDAREMMTRFTALVIPSLTEGVPITLLEAMAQGVPVVASEVGGIPEVLTGGRDALLVPPAEPRALADAMTRVADDRALAISLASAARERFLGAYTTRRVGDALDTLYRDLTGDAR